MKVSLSPYLDLFVGKAPPRLTLLGPPKSVHHQIHVFQQRIVTESRSEKVVQFGIRLLEFRRIVTRFTEIEAGLVLLRFVANVHDGDFVM